MISDPPPFGGGDSPHHCHAIGCEARVPPAKLMCYRHWRMVPADLKCAVWRYYRPGQERDKCPSMAYLRAARAAILSVHEQEQEGMLPFADV